MPPQRHEGRETRAEEGTGEGLGSRTELLGFPGTRSPTAHPLPWCAKPPLGVWESGGGGRIATGESLTRAVFAGTEDLVLFMAVALLGGAQEGTEEASVSVGRSGFIGFLAENLQSRLQEEGT